MGRPKADTQTKADAFDKVFAQIDPEVLLAGLLGATAARGGLTPPFTAMLMSLSVDGSVAKGLEDKFKIIWQTGSPAFAYYSAVEAVLKAFEHKAQSGENMKDEQAVSATAIMASGAFEAMLMMEFAKNPEFQKAIYNMFSTGASGLTAIAKAI